MVQKTKKSTTKKKTQSKASQKKNLAIGLLADRQMERDFRDSLLIVSVVINLFIFCLWLAVRLTDQYDSALTMFLFNR